MRGYAYSGVLSCFKVLTVKVDNSYSQVNSDCCILPVFDGSSSELPMVNFRRLHPDSIDFGVLRAWIVHCQTHHSRVCKPLGSEESQHPPGLMVIDCKARMIIKAPENCSYAALSYVWGTPTLGEVQCTNEAPRKGNLPDYLPSTISDTIQVVLELNLRYLWVDKYCIDQSDETDMQRQISTMDLIYNWAVVTIVAAAGDDPSFGLPGVGHRRRLEQPTINLNGQIWVSSLQNPEMVIQSSKWLTRAWTYQEGLFSRRRLIFTGDQVYYECNTTRCRETVDFNLHQFKDDMDYRPGGVFRGGFGVDYEGLNDHLERYTKRNLTRQSDIINGLRGVLRAFSRMPTPIRHYWGVPMDYRPHDYSPWRSNNAPLPARKPSEMFPGYLDAGFAYGICWDLEMPTVRREGFPSWSWAGWIGPLKHYAWGFFSPLSADDDPEVKIWLQKVDGTYHRLSECVIVDVNQSYSTTTSYTPLLRIEAWTVEVRFKYFTEGVGDVKSHWQERNQDPRFFTTVQRPVVSGEPRNTLYWPLVLSVQVDDNDELHSELCTQKFDCILLKRYWAYGGEAYGLVVRRNGVTMERIGNIKLDRSYLEIEGCTDLSYNRRYARRDLLNFLPRVRRTILLG